IMEYLVKISKKARILKFKRRYLKITVLTTVSREDQYTVSIKEDYCSDKLIHQGRYDVSVPALHKRPRRKQD
ncbi:hypothetical protein Tco_0437509, partial [Tanacetum coccineum]